MGAGGPLSFYQIMSYVLGFDASTQSCSATLVNCATYEVVGEISVNFGKELPQYGAPSGFIPGGAEGEVHSDPRMWLDALELVMAQAVAAQWPLSEVVGISGSGCLLYTSDAADD